MLDLSAGMLCKISCLLRYYFGRFCCCLGSSCLQLLDYGYGCGRLPLSDAFGRHAIVHRSICRGFVGIEVVTTTGSLGVRVHAQVWLMLRWAAGQGRGMRGGHWRSARWSAWIAGLRGCLAERREELWCVARRPLMGIVSSVQERADADPQAFHHPQ
jgi:hypothetical protein